MRARNLDVEINKLVSELGDEQKQKVLQYVRNLKSETFDYVTWWQRMDARQAELKAAHGGDLHINVADYIKQCRNR